MPFLTESEEIATCSSTIERELCLKDELLNKDSYLLENNCSFGIEIVKEEPTINDYENFDNWLVPVTSEPELQGEVSDPDIIKKTNDNERDLRIQQTIDYVISSIATSNYDDRKRALHREYNRRYRQKQYYNGYFEREKERKKRYREKVAQSPELQEKEREMFRKRRSEDPNFLENERKRWKKRSADPKFKEKERERIRRFRAIKAIERQTGLVIDRSLSLL